MFAGFAHLWTPIALARELGARPLGLTVAGTPVALFRDGAGRAHGLIDRCPHRSVKLSLGRVEGGCLTCPFHGWRFAGDGACVEVPWHPEARLERLGATPVPTREVGGFIWIFTGLEAQGEPAPPAEVLQGDATLYGNTFTWQAHWTRVVENMADDAHLPFVHPRTIGRGMRKRITSRAGTDPDRRGRLALDVQDHPWGTAWTVVMDGVAADWSSELRFPNVSLLRIPVPGKTLGICMAAVPIDEGRVRVLQLGYRNFLKSSIFHPIFNAINRRVLREDQAVVEASPPGPVPPPRWERSVATDEVGLRFRKRLYAELLPPGDG